MGFMRNFNYVSFAYGKKIVILQLQTAMQKYITA